jgi:hypothetical protein
MVEMQTIAGYSQCTLPRQHHSPWGGPPGPSVQIGPPMGMQYATRYNPPVVPPPPSMGISEFTIVPQPFDDDSADTPLMVAKRESTV